MRICVFGAGAVGGHFAVRLARAGHAVCVVARGDHLAAIKTRGLTVMSGDQRLHATVGASDDPAVLGPQDVVLVTLKAHDLPSFAMVAPPLLHAQTSVVFAHNGIPWWYADGSCSGDRTMPRPGLLDPGNAIRNAIGVGRTLGGVIYSSNDQVEPGVIVNNSAHRNCLLIGEIDDARTSRVKTLREVLTAAGIDSPPVAAVRQKIWDKLIANLSVSILSFLTETTSRTVYDDAHLRAVADNLAKEGIAIAHAHGYACQVDASGPAPGHKSSMLQDFERGRRAEIDAVLLAPQAFAREARLATPVLDTIIQLVCFKTARGWRPMAH